VRRLVRVLLGIVAVLVLLMLALPLFMNANEFRPAMESELTRSLGRKVTVGDLKLGVFSGTVTAQDLSVADDPSFSRAPFLTAKTLAFSIHLFEAIFQHKLDVSAIEIDSPQVALIQAPSGWWNFSTLGTSATGTSPTQTAPAKPVSAGGGDLSLSIKSLKIEKAHLSIAQGPKPRILNNVDLEITNFAPTSAFPFTMSGQAEGGGDIALNGQAGPIDPANAAHTPLNAKLKLTALNLVASGSVPASSGVDGLLSVDGTVTSNGRTAHVTGKLQAEKLKLAPGGAPTRNPLQLDVDLTEDLVQDSGQLTRGDVAIGGVKASLTGTWVEQGSTPVLKMLLSANGVPVTGIEDLLPALAISLPSGSKLEGGTSTAALTIAGPATALVIAGPVSLHDSRLTGFDLGAKMAPIEKLAGIQSGPNTVIQVFSTNLRIAPEGTSLQDIHLVLPSTGELTGAGTVSRNQALDFKMRAIVRAGGLVSTAASTGIPFFIRGTASNPQFQPDVAQLAQDEINQRLHGLKVGGVDAGEAAGGILQGLFGKKK
jgi:AsmA protein